jgi:hypothetical protein
MDKKTKSIVTLSAVVTSLGTALGVVSTDLHAATATPHFREFPHAVQHKVGPEVMQHKIGPEVTQHKFALEVIQNKGRPDAIQIKEFPSAVQMKIN